MGDELLEILEGQKQLDAKFEQLTSDKEVLRDRAKGVTSATQGDQPHHYSYPLSPLSLTPPSPSHF